MLLFLCLFVNYHTPGKIRNGYEIEIRQAEIVLSNLQKMSENIQFGQQVTFERKEKLESEINRIKEYIVLYQLTESLLKQFKMIAPDLYREIDTIKDLNKQSVDVFVKFLTIDNMPIGINGTTNVGQSQQDFNTYSSEYGSGTVSVKIVIRNKSLRLLAHELGHVKYQVPNLASYVKFYHKKYHHVRSIAKGHHPNDPSGIQAHLFAKRLDNYYQNYGRNKHQKIDSPVVQLQNIRKSLNNFDQLLAWSP